MTSRGEEHVLIKDPLSLTYYRLPILQYRILSALDGRRSLDEILSRIHQAGVSVAIEAPEVFRLILDLASKHLIFSRRAGTIDGLLTERNRNRWQRFLAAVSNPFFIQLPGLYPRQYLSRAAKRLGWAYTGTTVLLVAAFVLFSWGCCLLQADRFTHELRSGAGILSGQGIWTLWIVVGLLKVFHELSHGIACERLGAECQSIGFAFLMFSPCMYCDVSDAWLLDKKRDRIAISLAGIYVELFLSALGFWIWNFTGPGLLHLISLQVFLAGSVATLAFNANPLLKFDGYYVLADLLEIPNLYQRSRKAVGRMAALCCLGIHPPKDQPVSERPCQSILLAYGLASLIYQIPMILGIWLFLVYFFDSLGLIAVPMIAFVLEIIRGTSRLFAWSTQLAQQPASARPRTGHALTSAVLLMGLLTGLWFCPIRRTVTVPILVEPRSSIPVYVETPGTVRQIAAREGDFVEAGQMLVELEDLTLDRRLIALEGLEVQHDIDFRMAQSIGDPDLMHLAQTAKESVSAQLKHARLEKRRLQLRAELAGTVMSVDRSAIESETPTAGLQDGSPSPLSPECVGAYFDRRTCVCQIVPGKQWQAKIWTRQDEHQHLTKDQNVVIRLDSFPGTNITASVVSISTADETTLPAGLVIRNGGPFATKFSGTDDIPIEPLYSALLELDPVDLPLRPGMRGSGQFSRPTMTVGSWLVEQFHRSFAVR